MILRTLFVATAVVAISAQAFAQKQPEIKFDNETIQFGRVPQGAIVDTFFTFKNTGTVPLHIASAKGSCGCTRPTWPDQPIEPGGEGRIGVRFNSAKRSGDQAKTITIESDATRAVLMLRIEGFVVAPEEKPAENQSVGNEKPAPTGEFMPAAEGQRPHQIEFAGSRQAGLTSIEFSEKGFDFGKVAEGTTVRHTFTFKNTGAEVFLLSSLRDNCNCLQFVYDETLMVKPGGSGSFEVSFETTGQKGEHDKKIMVGGNMAVQEIPLTLKGKVK